MKKNLSEKRISDNAGLTTGKANDGTDPNKNIKINIKKVFCGTNPEMLERYHQDFNNDTQIVDFYESYIDSTLIVRKTKKGDLYLYTVYYEGYNLGETQDPNDVETIIRRYEWDRDGYVAKVKCDYAEENLQRGIILKKYYRNGKVEIVEEVETDSIKNEVVHESYDIEIEKMLMAEDNVRYMKGHKLATILEKERGIDDWGIELAQTFGAYTILSPDDCNELKERISILKEKLRLRKIEPETSENSERTHITECYMGEDMWLLRNMLYAGMDENDLQYKFHYVEFLIVQTHFNNYIDFKVYLECEYYDKGNFKLLGTSVDELKLLGTAKNDPEKVHKIMLHWRNYGKAYDPENNDKTNCISEIRNE